MQFDTKLRKDFKVEFNPHITEHYPEENKASIQSENENKFTLNISKIPSDSSSTKNKEKERYSYLNSPSRNKDEYNNSPLNRRNQYDYSPSKFKEQEVSSPSKNQDQTPSPQEPQTLSPQKPKELNNSFEELLKEAENADFVTSLYLYDQAIKKKPRYALACKISHLYKIKAYSELIDDVKNLLNMDKNNLKAAVVLAESMFEVGNVNNCIEICKDILNSDLQNIKIHNIWGDIIMEQEIYHDILNIYSKILNNDPKNMFVNGSRGHVLYLLNKVYLKEAMNSYDNQIKMYPQDFTAYLKKAKALQDEEKTQEAIQCFNKASDLVVKGTLKDNKWSLEGFKISLTPHEVSLIKFISEIRDIQQETQNQEKSALQLRILDLFMNQDKKSNLTYIKMSSDIEELKKKTIHQISMQNETQNHELSDLKKSFKNLELENIELYSYLKTFYWVILNIFQAFKSINKGKLNINFEVIEENDPFCIDVKNASYLVSEGTSDAPITGGGIPDILSIIDRISNSKRKAQVEAINKIILSKFGSEDDLSFYVAKLSLALTNAKELKQKYSTCSSPSNDHKKAYKRLSEMINKIKGNILLFIDLPNKGSFGVNQALQDVVLVMTYLCENTEAVIVRKDSLEKQIEAIVTFDVLEQMVENKAKNFDKFYNEKKREDCSFFGIL